MKTEKIYTQHEENKEWANNLSFYKDEIKILSHRLTEIASKNTSNEILAKVEHFQNQLIIQKNHIDRINHEINISNDAISTDIKRNGTAVDHRSIKDYNVKSFESIFISLKIELNTFLSRWMQMKYSLRSINLILVGLFLSASAYSQTSDETNLKDTSIITLKEFNKWIGSEEKPVLVYFSADWCMVCAKMKSVMETIEKEFSNKIQILRIDTERDKEVTNEFEIDALPILMLYKHGSRKWIHIGLLDGGIICTEIELYLN
ncbi:MAG: thioredoxin domain-containing protein [Bacteroidota bacterium]